MARFSALTLALLLRAASACTGPAINAASADLIKSFESFQPDICTLKKNCGMRWLHG